MKTENIMGYKILTIRVHFFGGSSAVYVCDERTADKIKSFSRLFTENEEEYMALMSEDISRKDLETVIRNPDGFAMVACIE